MNRIRLNVLVGPTASGKTRMAVDAAHALGSEIISADSRQTYRGLDIGSGKDLDEYSRVSPPVPVHLIDVADPAMVYTLFHYQRDCYQVLEEKSRVEPYRDGGRPLLMAGGTGLYVEAVLRGYRIASVPEDTELRDRLMERDAGDLEAELQREDPELFARTDLSNKKRIARALEIVAASRRGPVNYTPDPPVEIDHRVFGVEVDREELGRRIDRRLDERLDEGLIEEVEGLLAGGLPVARMNQLGLEYREVTAHLQGDKSREQMIEDLRTGIRQLAKRQRTWFRGLPRRGIEVTWIAAHEWERLTTCED